MSNIIKSSLALTFSLALSACGGGGGSDSSSSNGGGGNTTTPATASISANPATVMVDESTTITWSSTNASSCTASGAWSGDKSTSGTESVVMSDFGDQFFTLNCGGAVANAMVTVNSDISEGSCVNPHSAEIYES